MSSAKTVIDAKGSRYELTKKIGQGGQGAVYAVKGGKLAVKVVPGRGPAHRERMRNQLAHVRRLPLGDLSLAKPLEMLRPPHTGYVMELLTGMEPIKNLLKPPKGKAPSVAWYHEGGGLRRRLLLLARAASILARLHGKGLAYADPSPANIFVSADPAYHEVWFIDSDNLCYESSPNSKGGVYTPFYGAPEMVRGESGVTTLTDMHAFAVIAFQVLVLAHPFIGDYVNDGDPELEEQAMAGKVPWIDDVEDACNRASFGVDRDGVLSKRLKELFQQTFGAGRKDPTARPGAAEWAKRLFAAADATIFCPDCKGSYYFNEPTCPWCDASRPGFAMALFHLFDPGYGPNGGILEKPHGKRKRAVIVDQFVLSEGVPRHITRRMAIGPEASMPDEPMMEVVLKGNQVFVSRVDGNTYRLSSPTGRKESEIGEIKKSIGLKAGEASWRVHFGETKRLHRLMRFEIRSGGHQ